MIFLINGPFIRETTILPFNYATLTVDTSPTDSHTHGNPPEIAFSRRVDMVLKNLIKHFCPQKTEIRVLSLVGGFR